MKKTLACRPLDAAAFADFGDVISTDNRAWRHANDGRAQRFFDLARLDHDDAASRPEVSIYRVQASALPMSVNNLERHPHSAQLFMPVAGGQYLVVACKPDAAGRPDLATLAAFVAEGTQGIAYKPGTWHMPIAALDAPADFLMVMWECGGDSDCETHALDGPVQVSRA